MVAIQKEMVILVNSKQVAGYNTDWNENTQTHIVVLKKNKKAILNNFLDWIEKFKKIRRIKQNFHYS